MATVYFNKGGPSGGSDDGYDTFNILNVSNWYSNSACTTPLGHLPGATDYCYLHGGLSGRLCYIDDWGSYGATAFTCGTLDLNGVAHLWIIAGKNGQFHLTCNIVCGGTQTTGGVHVSSLNVNPVDCKIIGNVSAMWMLIDDDGSGEVVY